MGSVPVDSRRLSKVLARLQQSPSEAVRFAVQAELNAEALDQQQEMFQGQLAALQQGKPDKPEKKSPARRTKAPTPPKKEPPA